MILQSDGQIDCVTEGKKTVVSTVAGRVDRHLQVGGKRACLVPECPTSKTIFANGTSPHFARREMPPASSGL